MSGADDLRTAIEDALRHNISIHDQATGVLAVLGDPVLGPALIEAMGLETTPYVLRHRGSDWTLVRPRASS